jgi:hypothetical protein
LITEESLRTPGRHTEEAATPKKPAHRSRHTEEAATPKNHGETTRIVDNLRLDGWDGADRSGRTSSIKVDAMRRTAAFAVAGVLGLALLGVPPATAAPGDKPGSPTVYVGELTTAQFRQLVGSGLDREDIATRAGAAGKVRVEATMTSGEAATLTAKGLALTEKQVDGSRVSSRMATQNASGYTVFRSWSEAGGLRDEFVGLATTYPGLVKQVTIGTSVKGQPILAFKLTKDARTLADGRRPAVLYSSAQHAREWITPEMNRRLFRYLLDGYSKDAAIKKLVDTTELWFVPVANPDGYDYTFTKDNRLWRKNLRDNDGDGVTTGVDGVDPNRNWPTKWGYDNEGSSPSIGSQTYRGTAPASEPETRALDGLMGRVGFEFGVNYHSAAELLLYGVGWQVATPTPDDLLYETIAGDDAHPAVPGYDPDISAELYTTNGETTEHAHLRYGTLAYTPEMSTCETASNVDRKDAFDPADCASVFNFPDSEALVQAEFEKNLPFALSIATSAKDPSDPVSVVGRTAPNFQVDAFTTSYGDPQPVAVTARRDIKDLRLRYRIAGGSVRSAAVSEWKGGERYGGEEDVYYAEYRGTVTGARVGQKVEVWFDGTRGRTQVASEHFTYTLKSDSSARVLVVANEDYEGVNPKYPGNVTAPKYAQVHVDALAAAGYQAQVWDVSAQGVPHHLGVLGHFDAVLWYLGDNRLTQDQEDAVTVTPIGRLADAAVAERQQYLTIAVRDYLNEGGRLLHAGETTGYFGVLGSDLGGIYYGLDGAPDQDCVVTVDFFSDCLLLADDFMQYYLGAFNRAAGTGATALAGVAAPLAGTTTPLAGQPDNPIDEPGSFVATSTVLPVAQFPQFTSQVSGVYSGGAGPGPFEPFEGDWYAGSLHRNDAYQRLTRTVDLAGVSAGQNPALTFAVSYDTERGYDHVIVEARTAGGANWTTLPEAGGLTSTAVPTECEAGFLLKEHPFLAHYLTLGNPCTATGTSGSWNSMTGNSGGWKQASFNLSAYAGQQVEVSIAYVTDPGSGGAGVFVDDTRVTAGGQTLSAEGFETGLGPWSATGPPAGSSPALGSFVRAQALVGGAVTTEDTVLLGVGLEQVTTPAARAALLMPIMAYLLR